MTNPITISQYESQAENLPKKSEILEDTSNMTPMEKAQYLMKRKDAIEKEILEWEEILKSVSTNFYINFISIYFLLSLLLLLLFFFFKKK